MTDTERRIMQIDIDQLRHSARNLIKAMDDMHSRGETFTARVSIAASELRQLLQPTWPKEGQLEPSHSQPYSEETP